MISTFIKLPFPFAIKIVVLSIFEWPLKTGFTVRGDNRGLSYVHVDKHGITILYHLHQSRHCISRDYAC